MNLLNGLFINKKKKNEELLSIFNRLFGVFPTARWPLRMYNIFDCIARINTMFSVGFS